MTITRTRIRCRERACPWPFDEEFHKVPWCRGIKEHECFGGVEHQHWPKRSQGGKEIVALLCSGAHQLIDSGPWGNAVKEINGKRVYMIWDLHGEILYERQEGRNDGSSSVRDKSGSALVTGGDDRVPSDGLHAESLGVVATGEGEQGFVEHLNDGAFSEHRQSLPSPAAPAPSDGGESHTGILAGNTSPPSPGAPYFFQDNGIEWEPEFTFDDWARAAERVKTESVGRQWRVGDLVNAERWAECSQVFDELGYPPETQANYGRISAAYKLAERRPLSFTMHQSVYKHPERLVLLDAAVENGWDRAELRKQAGYEKRSGLRRFPIDELRKRLAGYENRALRNNARKWAEAWLESLAQ